MRWWYIPGGRNVLLATCKRLAGWSDSGSQKTFIRFKKGRVCPSSFWVRELSTCRVFIVAGESSGEAIGSRLMAALRCLSPQPLEFAGVGGPLMEKEGLQSLFPMEDISVMGLVELLPHHLRLWRRLRETIAAAIAFQPNLVITIDSKGFSFRILQGITDVIQDGGLHNGLLPRVRGDAATFREQHGLETGSTLLSVLPGSRLQEVKRMLPIFDDAVVLLQKFVPDLTAVTPTAQSGTVTRLVEASVAHWSVPVVVLPGASDTDKYNSFSASNAALCTSGTAVLQVHLAHVPCVAAYRAHLLTECFIRLRTKLKFISLPNIILNSAVIPEALFGACTAGQIASYLRPLIEDDEMKKKQLLSAEKIMKLLAPPFTYEMPINSTLGAHSLQASILPRKPSFVAASCILKLLQGKVSTISRRS